MTEFHAQPYLLDHTGFFFDSIETFKTGMKRNGEIVEIELDLIVTNAQEF